MKNKESNTVSEEEMLEIIAAIDAKIAEIEKEEAEAEKKRTVKKATTKKTSTKKATTTKTTRKVEKKKETTKKTTTTKKLNSVKSKDKSMSSYQRKITALKTIRECVNEYLAVSSIEDEIKNNKEEHNNRTLTIVSWFNCLKNEYPNSKEYTKAKNLLLSLSKKYPELINWVNELINN